VAFDNTDWDKWTGVPAVLPASNVALPAPISEFFGGPRKSVDLTAFFNQTVQVPGHPAHPQWESFWTSPIHFVFIGNDESSPQENNSCIAQIGDISLTITADH
jgi:hypothetical protein